MDYIADSLSQNKEENNGKKIDEKVLKYRNKHKKCKYCKYLRLIVPCVDIVPAYYKCVAKDKIIQDTLPDMTNIRRFCSCYEAKEKLK